jgi:hypothetical protein
MVRRISAGAHNPRYFNLCHNVSLLIHHKDSNKN